MTYEQAARLKALVTDKNSEYTPTDLEEIFKGEQIVIRSFIEACIYDEVYNRLNPFHEQKVFYLMPSMDIKYEGEVLEFMNFHAQYFKLKQDLEKAEKLFFQYRAKVEEIKKEVKRQLFI